MKNGWRPRRSPFDWLDAELAEGICDKLPLLGQLEVYAQVGRLE
jgi:hypothetical protein